MSDVDHRTVLEAGERSAMAFCLGLLTVLVAELPDDKRQLKDVARSMILRAAPAAGVEIAADALRFLDNTHRELEGAEP